MHADWLALRWESPELPCYFVDVNMHGVVQKIVKIPSICQNKAVFGIPSYSMCVVYKKNKIIHLSDSEGGGYLPANPALPKYPPLFTSTLVSYAILRKQQLKETQTQYTW